MSTEHSIAATKFQKNHWQALWHNQTLWLVREKRDRQAKQIPEWEDLRRLAEQIKLHTISNLDKYLELFSKNAEKNGVIVHWAKDAQEHNEIVYNILKKKNIYKLIKSKSMLTEECLLNDYLENKGVEVIESDLGERILQLHNSPPSHIVMPAIHMTRQEVSKIFEDKLNTEKNNSDPTYLTHSARKSLRNDFLTAEAGMTGVNFAIASTGEVVVCTNEGNADLGASIPNVHIASMGLEKIIPDQDSLAVFIRLLARSATGQPVTTYTSHFKKAKEGAEMHIIIVDNGRSNILANEKHVKSLNCIRCGACMNTCPVYRRSGGYSYSYFIPGPIGINLGMLRDPKKFYGNVSACSLCYSCNNVCPVKIDLADQIYNWRQNLDDMKLSSPSKKFLSKGMKVIFNHPILFNLMIKLARHLAKMPRFIKSDIDEWEKGRTLPKLAKESFTEMWKKGKIKRKGEK